LPADILLLTGQKARLNNFLAQSDRLQISGCSLCPQLNYKSDLFPMCNYPKTDTNQTPESVNQGKANSHRITSGKSNLQNRASERRFHEQSYLANENNNAVINGLMNLSLTSIISFLVAALFFIAHKNEDSLLIVPALNDTPSQSSNKESSIKNQIKQGRWSTSDVAHIY